MKLICTIIFFALPFTLQAKRTIALESGEQQTALIELYTSEGCSSCPPADNWLSGLKTDPNLWSEFIPVAFHVDYWDYVGWKDTLALPANTQRQGQYKANIRMKIKLVLFIRRGLSLTDRNGKDGLSSVHYRHKIVRIQVF